MSRFLLYITTFLLSYTTIYSQDLTSFANRKIFSINGGVGASGTYYQSNESVQSRPTFAWTINGNLTPSIYGFSFPLSFVITQSGRSFSYGAPVFSQFGITPSWKWIKLYLGYRSMHFSQFTFDGQTFLGAGIELTPKIFRFSAFYGILNKPIQGDTSAIGFHPAQYKRRAWGVKLGVGTATNYFDFIYFHAKDDSNSLQYDPSSTIRPEENHVFGVGFRFTVKKHFYIAGEAAASLVNTDLAVKLIVSDTSSGYNTVKLFNVNYASQFGFAGKATIGVLLKGFNLSLAYQRIYPSFVSFGTPYTLSDIEGLIGTMGVSADKGKVNVNLCVNAQHNDLEHNLATETRTLTGSLNLVTLFSRHFIVAWTGTGTYLQQQNGTVAISDTFRQNQVIATGAIVPSYNFQKGNISHTISLSANVMYVDNLNPFMTLNNSSNLAGTLNYNAFLSHQSLSFNCSVNANRYLSSFSQSNSIGAHAGVSGQLLKDKGLGLQGSVGYQENFFKPGGAQGNIMLAGSVSYRLKKHHSFSANVNYIISPAHQQQTENPYAVTSNNLMASLAYAYNFSYTTKK